MDTNTHTNTEALQTNSKLAKGALIIESPDVVCMVDCAGRPKDDSRILLGMPRAVARRAKQKEAPLH